MAAPNHSTRPFWAGLNPDHPEPLDKALAALHCYQVAQPDCTGLYFEFTVKHSDHYRIYDGFPELRKLAAALGKEIHFLSTASEFDLSTGKLATMTPEAYNRVRVTVIFDVIRILSTALDVFGRLPAPIGPLALKVALGANKDSLFKVRHAQNIKASLGHYRSSNYFINLIMLVQATAKGTPSSEACLVNMGARPMPNFPPKRTPCPSAVTLSPTCQ